MVTFTHTFKFTSAQHVLSFNMGIIALLNWGPKLAAGVQRRKTAADSLPSCEMRSSLGSTKCCFLLPLLFAQRACQITPSSDSSTFLLLGDYLLID